MKVIELTQLGNPADVLALKQIPDQTPADGEARVKVLAAPIHPANLLQIAGQYAAAPELPSIPGGEGIGTTKSLLLPLASFRPRPEMSSNCRCWQ